MCHVSHEYADEQYAIKNVFQYKFLLVVWAEYSVDEPPKLLLNRIVLKYASMFVDSTRYTHTHTLSLYYR